MVNVLITTNVLRPVMMRGHVSVGERVALRPICCGRRSSWPAHRRRRRDRPGANSTPGFAIADQFAVPANIRCGHQRSLRHRLQRFERRDEIGQPAAGAGQGQNVDQRIIPLHIRMRDAACKVDGPACRGRSGQRRAARRPSVRRPPAAAAPRGSFRAIAAWRRSDRPALRNRRKLPTKPMTGPFPVRPKWSASAASRIGGSPNSDRSTPLGDDADLAAVETAFDQIVAQAMTDREHRIGADTARFSSARVSRYLTDPSRPVPFSTAASSQNARISYTTGMPSRLPARSAAWPHKAGEWACSTSGFQSAASASIASARMPISRHSRIPTGPDTVPLRAVKLQSVCMLDRCTASPRGACRSCRAHRCRPPAALS